jgi:hypothetical protein
MTSTSNRNVFLSCSTDGYEMASTAMPIFAPIFRAYREEDLTPKPCEYCGNTSTLRDSRGNCIGCGAVRK